MNTYIYPIYDRGTGDIFIESVKARNLKEAFEKLSDEYELDTLCENQLEFEESMRTLDYEIGSVINLEEF